MKKLLAGKLTAALVLGLAGCVPVSYTHLDVYKRQQQGYVL